jgi:hypothetical protein
MKELTNHTFMDWRTVKAWETTKGGYVQVYDVRELNHGRYSVEVFDNRGGMESIYGNRNIDKCIAYAMRYAEQN